LPRPWAETPGIDSINRLLQYQRGAIASGGGSTAIRLPFDSDTWQTRAANRMGLTASLRPEGWPRRKKSNNDGQTN
jgi:hypothetical protein